MFPIKISQVMIPVIQIINKCITSALNHRQFRALLDEENKYYKDLLMLITFVGCQEGLN